MVRSLLALSLLSAAAAFQVEEVHEHMDYTGMKSSMLALAKKMEKDGVNPGVTAAIQGFLDQIKKALLPALEADKTHAQTSLDDALDVVNGCNTKRSEWVASDTGLKGHNEAVTSANNDHNACRREEQNTYNTFEGDCSSFHDRVCKWDNCPCPDFSKGDTDAVDAYICCVQEFFAEHRGHYYDERRACQISTSLHHNQTAECDRDQGHFQDTFCDRETDIQEKCSNYEQCRCAAEAEFESMKSNVEALEEIFQNQFVALKCLECYGEEMLKNITDLSGCDEVGTDCEADYPGCPEIVYPTPDPFINCDEPYKNYPCTASFTDEFYGWIATEQPCTPIDACGADWCGDEKVTNNMHGGGRLGAYAECPDV